MTPAEIQAAIAVFQLLEPKVQSAIAGLIHAMHGKQIGSAQDYLDEAQKVLSAGTASAGTGTTAK